MAILKPMVDRLTLESWFMTCLDYGLNSDLDRDHYIIVSFDVHTAHCTLDDVIW